MKHTKNEYKVTICGVILFLLVAFASTVSVTEFTYDFNKTQEHDTAIYYAESMQLVIHTPFETACFYTVVEGATPSNEFDVSFGTEHEKTFEDLEEGLHKYYIQCENTSSPVMEISFKTKKEVSADIAISKDSPLKDGTV